MLSTTLNCFITFTCSLMIPLLLSCQTGSRKEAVKMEYTGPCGCALTKEQMIRQCPIDAIGDSVIICKVGTNNVIGSNRPPMTWTEFIASEYFGGEGLLVDCKTGKPLFRDAQSPIISYRKKRLIVDKRFHFDHFDEKRDAWIDIELPVWRAVVSAKKNELEIAPDSFIFKPPFHGPTAFARVSKEYEQEVKRTDHYMISNTVNRLLMCSICGDELSEKRLLSIEKDFAAYYANHPDSKEILDERLGIYRAYKSYLDKGGKRKYYNMSNFVNLKLE